MGEQPVVRPGADLDGGVHGVNDPAVSAAAASVAAVVGAVSAAGQVAVAELAHRRCARAFAEARGQGVSIRRLAAAVAEAAHRAGITPAAARAAGVPLPTSTAAVEGTAWAGRLLALPGESPVPCRGLVGFATRVYNLPGGAQRLAEVAAGAADVGEAVGQLRAVLAEVRPARAERARRPGEDPMMELRIDAADPAAVLGIAIHCLAIVDQHVRAGRLAPGPASHTLVSQAWRRLASIDAQLARREQLEGPAA